MIPVTQSLPHPVTSQEGTGRATPAWRVQSVDRAVQLLRAVAEAGSTGAGSVDLATACGLNRATAWRLLSTLEAQGLVICDRTTNLWTIGRGLGEIARVSGFENTLRNSHEVLERLALRTGETAALAMMRRGTLAYVDEAAPDSIVAVTWAGRSLSLHATSTGKVLLAWSSETDRAGLLPRRLQRFTDTTITNRTALREDLAQTRERGYATCRGEFDASAWGVSVPVLDTAGWLLAVLSVWGPPKRVTPERFADLGAAAKAAARHLEVG